LQQRHISRLLELVLRPAKLERYNNIGCTGQLGAKALGCLGADH
jgi:hypothetical protein